MPSLAVRLVLVACCVVGVTASCSSSDRKKAVSYENAGGAGGEQDASGGGTRAGSNTSGKPQGGTAGTTNGGAATAGSLNDGGADGEGAASGQGGAAGEGAVSGQGGAAGEGAVFGQGGAGGEAGGSSTNCCDPQVNYSASGSVLPSDEACSPWTLTDTASPEAPTLNGGTLRVASSSDAEHMYFIHSEANLSFPDVFVFEARMKFVSGTGSTPSRTPASMAFVYGAQHMKNMLQMSATEVFILQSENVKGDSITFDTTSDFHTYRIVADTQANTLQVFIDDELELSGNTFADPNSGELVLFGESSIYAYGVSEWQFAKHNAYRCSIDGSL